MVCEKHVSINLYRYISKRHLTEAWKKIYDRLVFAVPTEEEIERVFDEAKQRVQREENLRMPVAKQGSWTKKVVVGMRTFK